MSARFCGKCGAEHPPEAAFCGNCGAPLGAPEPTPASTPSATQPIPAKPAPAAATPSKGAIPAAMIPELKTSNRMYAFIAAGVALLLIGGVLIFTSGSKDSITSAEPGEIFLEPADAPGEAPFTESVDTNTAPAPVQLMSATSPAPDNAPAGGSERTGVRSVQGVAPGLYGGTNRESACDVEKLIDFLQANPDKAAAWASVQGITVRSIPQFVRSLTPVVLRADTRVTNHGFFNGQATPFQSVLEAGTAVLVDDLGQPRVKCNCGNPLAPPQAQQTGVRYTGDRWPTFRPDRVLVIVNTKRVSVTTFILVNLVTPGYIQRPVGAPEPGQPPADGPILVDNFCDLFPEECQNGPSPAGDEPALGTGDVQVTLRWFSRADLDLAVQDPRGALISFDDPTSPSGGRLDVDSNGNCESRYARPVENIFWRTGDSPDGQYSVFVHYYAECPGGTGSQNFELTVLVGGVEVPIDLQTMSADGTTEATFDLMVADGQPQMTVFQTDGSLTPDKTLAGGFEKSATPPEPPPEEPVAEEPVAEEPPAEPKPMTLEESCRQQFPEAEEEAFPGSGPWWMGPENMEYTLCMHDPTQDESVGLDAVPISDF